MSVEIRQDLDQVKLSFSFQRHADLNTVKLIGALVSRSDSWEAGTENLLLQFEHSPGTMQVSKDCVTMRTLYRFIAKAPGKRLVEMLQIECTFEATYQLGNGYQPGEGEVNSFRSGNAVFNSWPFFREYVQSTAARMNLPIPPVSFLRLVPLGPTEGEPKQVVSEVKTKRAKNARFSSAD